MSDQPNAGEWTADWLFEYARKREGYKTICDLHNEQLAAEQEKTRQVQIYIDGLQAGADSLRAELAAERKTTTFWHKHAEIVTELFGRERKALAAEQEKLAAAHSHINERADAIQKLREQLAAEREKIWVLEHPYPIGALGSVSFVRSPEEQAEIESGVHCSEQLATEREHTASLKRELHACLGDLTDERDHVATLVDALKTVSTGCISALHAKSVADAALAKVGK